VAVSGKTEGAGGAFDQFALERRSTGEQVAQAIREAILSGRLEPGAHLREATMAEAFGVSRNTLRGAIQVLARDGLVTHRVHRGAFVTELDPEAIADIFRARRIVELSALGGEAGGADLAPLEVAQAALREAIDGGDEDGIVMADLAFHRGLADLSRSSRLSTLFSEMEAETRLSALLVGNAHLDSEELYAEHGEILDLLRRGEVDAARELLARHLDSSEQLLLDALAARREAAA
jgi:DNA-binding GntR family transcriptional regulator